MKRRTRRSVFNTKTTDYFRECSDRLYKTVSFSTASNFLNLITDLVTCEISDKHLNPELLSDHTGHNYSPGYGNTYITSAMFALIPGLKRYNQCLEDETLKIMAAWAKVPPPIREMEPLRQTIETARQQLIALLRQPTANIRRILGANHQLRLFFPHPPQDNPYPENNGRSRLPLNALTQVAILCASMKLEPSREPPE